MRRIVRTAAAAGLAFLFAAGVAAASERTVRIGIVADGPWERNETARRVFQREIGDLLRGEFDVRFPEESYLVADWSRPGIEAALDRLLADPEIDMVLALGEIVSHLATERPGGFRKPVIAPFLVKATVPPEIGAPPGGGSGVPNLVYFIIPELIRSDIAAFRELTSCRRLASLHHDAEIAFFPEEHADLFRYPGVERVDLIPVGSNAAEALARIPEDAEAVYLSFLPRLNAEEFDELIEGLIERKLPSYALMGRMDVDRGVFAGMMTENFIDRRARRTALTAQRILLGDAPEEIPVAVGVERRLSINMGTARRIGVSPPWAILNEADLVQDFRIDVERRIDLAGAMREAVRVNLDLASKLAAVEAGRGNVGEARSRLLPRIDAGASFVVIDEDRAASSFGQTAERSLGTSLGASMPLFSERAWAGFDVEKRLQEGRVADGETLRLDIARDAASAYLRLLAARVRERIQKDNLKVTRRNLELARVRVAVGSAGPAEVYRWEAELAGSRESVIAANGARNLAEMELNRILRRPIEESFLPEEAGMDDPALVIRNAPLYEYINNRTNFRLLRDFLSARALENAPELRRMDAFLAARERALRSETRRFWAPDLALAGSAERILEKSGAGSEGGFDLSGLPPDLAPIGALFPETPDDDHWSAALTLTLPLFEGGDRFAARSRARAELEGLRADRDAAADRIEQRTRSALHLSGVRFAAIDLRRDAAEAARKTLETVTDAYGRGAASILELLDAQHAALAAEEAAAIAVYEFLESYMDVQRAIGSFGVFQTEEERRAAIDELETYILENGGALPRRSSRR